jgi:colicin import membrane protein
MTTETPEVLPPSTSAIADYNATEARLAALREQYAGAKYDVTTGAGMKQAVEARRELRDLRVALEGKRKELKAPILERGKLIDAEAARITAELVALEDPIDQQIKDEEARKAREKAEREKAERERVAGIHAAIARINAIPTTLIGASAEAIAAALVDLEAEPVDEDAFNEFLPQAQEAVRNVRDTLALQRQRQADHEAAQEQLRRDQEELARIRAEADARAAEAEAERKRKDEEAAAERRRADEEAAAARAAAQAEQDARDAAARAEREQAEADAVAARKAQQDREDAERAERQRQEDAERERLAEQARKDAEAAAAERARLEAEHLQNVNLHDAAQSAHDLLAEVGYASHLTTRALAAALARCAS